MEYFVKKNEPDIIINLAALTNVDRCEHDIDLAYKILFYGGKWYDYEIFSKQIYLLKEKNHIFFKDIYE